MEVTMGRRPRTSGKASNTTAAATPADDKIDDAAKPDAAAGPNAGADDNPASPAADDGKPAADDAAGGDGRATIVDARALAGIIDQEALDAAPDHVREQVFLAAGRLLNAEKVANVLKQLDLVVPGDKADAALAAALREHVIGGSVQADPAADILPPGLSLPDLFDGVTVRIGGKDAKGKPASRLVPLAEEHILAHRVGEASVTIVTVDGRKHVAEIERV
jgi:hypothetical protein